MQFVLTGFTQDVGFRVFVFERAEEDRTRSKFTVRADLALIRRYNIRLQELPLMCKALLERRIDGDDRHTLVFTEDEMSRHAKDTVAAKDLAASRRKPPRRPTSDKVGTAWRGPQQVEIAPSPAKPIV